MNRQEKRIGKASYYGGNKLMDLSRLGHRYMLSPRYDPPAVSYETGAGSASNPRRRRAEAARRLAVSVRCVDAWAKKGILEKRILPGHTRASGFLESAVSALIHGEGHIR